MEEVVEVVDAIFPFDGEAVLHLSCILIERACGQYGCSSRGPQLLVELLVEVIAS